MRAPFVLQVFATHLNSIVGAKDVPALTAKVPNPGASGLSSMVEKYPPKGALALAATAVSIFTRC
jgi:hypothetical protein